MWNQQMYTWFSRSWIKKLCCFYRWPSFKCEYIYTSAQNLQSRLENGHQAPCICWSCNRNVSVFQCNSSIQKQQKQSAKSKETVFLVVSSRFVSWRNPCSRQSHIMVYIWWSTWKRRRSSSSSKKSTQNNVPGDGLVTNRVLH